VKETVTIDPDRVEQSSKELLELKGEFGTRSTSRGEETANALAPIDIQKFAFRAAHTAVTAFWATRAQGARERLEEAAYFLATHAATARGHGVALKVQSGCGPASDHSEIQYLPPSGGVIPGSPDDSMNDFKDEIQGYPEEPQEEATSPFEESESSSPAGMAPWTRQPDPAESGSNSYDGLTFPTEPLRDNETGPDRGEGGSPRSGPEIVRPGERTGVEQQSLSSLSSPSRPHR